MAGSLFKNYPYDVPTEAFSLQLFQQVPVTPLCWILIYHSSVLVALPAGQSADQQSSCQGNI